MLNQRKHRLSLESLLTGRDPGTCAPNVSTEQLIDRLNSADLKSVQVTDAMAQSQNGIMAMESLNRQLRNGQAAGLNVFGARCLNLAAEQAMVQMRVRIHALPMSVKKLQVDPLEAINDAAGNITAALTDSTQMLGIDLARLISELTQKREAINLLIRQFHHRLDEIEEDLNAVEQGQVTPLVKPDTLPVPNHHYPGICYNGKGVVDCAATVVDDLLGLMKSHGALYEQLIHKQNEWLRQHKHAPLEAKGNFQYYRFNPVDFLIQGAQFYKNGEEDMDIFRGPELPGGKYVFCKTIRTAYTGWEAIGGLQGSQLILDYENGASAPARNESPMGDTLLCLRLDEIRSRLKELRMGLIEFSRWSNNAHRDFWKSAFFDEVICAALLQENGEGMQERAVSCLAAAVLKLLNDSGALVGAHVAASVNDLLSYMEDSLRAQLPQHNEGVPA